MAEVNTFACDECGAVKRASNHWFRAVARHDGGAFAVAQWDEDSWWAMVRTVGKPLHLCSESCVVKAMSKAIGAKQ